MSNDKDTITSQIIEEIEGDPEFDAKFDRQVELEDQMRGMGVDRHWSNIQKAQERGQETSTRSVRRLVNDSVLKISEAITALVAEADSGKAGRRYSVVVHLRKIEADTAAYITARAVLDGIARSDRMVPLARRVGTMIEDEIAFRAFREQDKKAHDWLVKREEKEHGGSYRMQRNVMRHNMKAREIEWEEWPVSERIHLGSKLVELMQYHTGLIQIVPRTVDRNKTEYYVEATKGAMDWINEENNRCEALAPVYLPTVVPPKPWTTPTDGGYWTGRVRRVGLIKTRNRAYIEELSELDMPKIYGAINAIQHTAWAINPDVLDVVRTLWNNGSTLGDIPAANDYDLPAKPAFLEDDTLEREDWTEEQLKQFKDWKRGATETYTKNAQLKSLRLQLVKCLMVGEMFEDEERIYFPHQMDFRGRAYPIPMFLNPQGGDIAKGLLTFADGVPINTEQGRAWLAVHGANLIGYDKVSLDERVAWVERNHDEIVAVANDPYNNRMWADADDPFQFLAFCFEWAAFSAEGYGYVSSLPVQMDGSCNGLQNFSAALRDPIGGEAVNLTPQELPADIYQKVADVVNDQIAVDMQSDDEWTAENAAGWAKHGVDRTVCKRPVMTLAYGAKEYGFKMQVFDDTVTPSKLNMGPDFPWDHSGWPAADYMGRRIWSAVSQVVVAAREAMDWFQKAARAAAKEGLPVRWTTPDGLPVLQAYYKMNTKRLRLTFGGERLRLNASTGPKESMELEKNKQANGISPNWVHSMDSSHMRQTVRSCWDGGMRSFALIHDSYGTHAENADALADILREEFIAMYTDQDVLDDFKAELEEQLPEGAELDALPSKGDLDLERVMQSDFFFA